MLNASTIVLLCAVAVGILAYWNYFKDIAKKETSPNKWSWLIWSMTTFVEAFTFNAVSEGWEKSIPFFVSGICCIVVTIRIWKRAQWKLPSVTETLSVIISAVAVVLWLKYGEALWAHLLMIVAIPISFLPTWVTTHQHPRGEASSAWWLWTIGDALALAYILMQPSPAGIASWVDKPYAITELACHASMAVLVTVLLLRRKGSS